MRKGLTRRAFIGGALAAGALGIGALTLRKNAEARQPLAVPAADPPLPAQALPELVAAAQAEGALTLIAMPASWANYGAIIDGFQKAYGIPVSVQSPNASSAAELTALRLMRGQSRLPDVIEVGPAFVEPAMAEGLLAPYRCSVWDAIPDDMKDPNGLWVSPYYGLVSFGVNTSEVGSIPASWAEVNSPRYRGMVATNGDPRQSNSAMNAVWSSALANGGSLDDVQPGIDFFGRLSAAEIYIPLKANVANLVNRQVLISIDWSFNMPAARLAMAASGYQFETAVPTDGVIGGKYCNAISNGAPHPNAARLWLEWVTGGPGALLYLDGGAIPALYPRFIEQGLVPESVQKALPPVDVLAKLTLPSLAQTTKASTQVAQQWDTVVG